MHCFMTISLMERCSQFFFYKQEVPSYKDSFYQSGLIRLSDSREELKLVKSLQTDGWTDYGQSNR